MLTSPLITLRCHTRYALLLPFIITLILYAAAAIDSHVAPAFLDAMLDYFDADIIRYIDTLMLLIFLDAMPLHFATPR